MKCSGDNKKERNDGYYWLKNLNIIFNKIYSTSHDKKYDI